MIRKLKTQTAIQEVDPSLRMRLGGFGTFTYTARRRYRGIDWYRTSFSDKKDREDWVADFDVRMCVTRYDLKRPGFGGLSFEKAADLEIQHCLYRCGQAISEKIAELAELDEARRKLQVAARMEVSP
jgi:hypothetical protein